MSQLPQERVQPAHNTYGKNSFLEVSGCHSGAECWGWETPVASWVGIPRAALASLGQAEWKAWEDLVSLVH